MIEAVGSWRSRLVDPLQGPAELALEGAHLVDALHEARGRKALALVEDLIAERAAGGQALAGQRDACLGHRVDRHQDLRAVAAQPVGHAELVQPGRHLGCVRRVELAVQHGHFRAAEAQQQEYDERQHGDADPANHRQADRSETAQGLDECVHAIDLSLAGRGLRAERPWCATPSEQLVVKIVLIQGNYCLSNGGYVSP